MFDNTRFCLLFASFAVMCGCSSSNEPVQKQQEDLSADAIWTRDEIAALAIGTRATVRTVLHGFEMTDLLATFAGYADMTNDARESFLLFYTDPTDVRWERWHGAAGGMSGSPVIIDGRIVGALSYGVNAPELSKPYQFVATPVHLMKAKLHDSEDAAFGAGKPGASAFRAMGLMYGPSSVVEAEKYVGFQDTPYLRYVGGGAARREIPADGIPDLQPGSAIAVPLVMGDVVVSAAVGTVSMVDSDRVYAFGHPFGFFGDIQLPFTAAYVDTTSASTDYAFKVAVSVGDTLGAITQDRLTGIAGVFDQVPDMVHVHTTVSHHGVHERYEHDVARVPDNAFMLPPTSWLVAVVNENLSILSSDEILPKGTIITQHQVTFKGAQTRAYKRSVGSGMLPVGIPTFDTYIWLDSLMNSWVPSEIEDVTTSITVLDDVQIAYLDFLEVPSEAHPGDVVTATVHYRTTSSWETRHQSFVFTVPQDVPDGSFLTVSARRRMPIDGWKLDAACQPIIPASLDEWIMYMNEEMTSEDTIEIVLEGPNLAYEQCVLLCGGGGGDPSDPSEMPDFVCMTKCSEETKCQPSMRVVMPFTISEHVIVGDLSTSIQVPMSVPEEVIE